MLKRIEEDKKRFAVAPAESILRKPSFYQDFYTVNIEHIKEFTHKAKAHHQKNPLLQKGILIANKTGEGNL
jgi:hypothetical protein